ncbi:hypothetical protein DYB32_010770 [Aphanomyces invadans]|uniref:Uncharacterized protein n=1 Tax=Aphanomyces invadans TaxID=157072 RepID=A0A418AF18_9STRA|nr:hypothetical protein DYB32_010770 [Aphanomyces invadans]
MSTPSISPPDSDDVHPDESSANRKFACHHDIKLLLQVTFTSPWEAEHGKQAHAWTSIAAALGQLSGFGLKKKGPAMKARFDALMSRFVRGESASLRKSGTSEEFDEREQLLRDIQTRMDDYKATESVRKDASKRKLEGIENSGTLLRKMAMEELERSSADGDPATPRKKKRKATPPSVDLNGLVHAIQMGIEDKRRREQLAAEQLVARLDFDREQAAIQAERQDTNQRMMIELINAIAKRVQ